MEILLQGNEACAQAAIAAGCRFYAGYPITPSSEIAEFMAKRLPSLKGTFIQMEDELASIAACIGVSATGQMAMTATSGPGFSLMQENLGYACLAEIPVVVVDAQRVGPSTGMPTLPSQGDVMQARWGTHGDHPAVVLVPSSVPEYYELTRKAFELSEALRTPVVILADEVVSHLREIVSIPEQEPVTPRRAPDSPPVSYKPYETTESHPIPAMAPFGSTYHFHLTGLYHKIDGAPTNDPEEAETLIRRLQKKMEYPNLTMVKRYYLEDADIAVVAYGSPVRAVLSAVRQARAEGVRAGLLQLSCVWPFPYDEVAELAHFTKAIIVPEMNLGQLVGEVERAISGKVPIHSMTRAGGDIFTPDEIHNFLLKLSDKSLTSLKISPSTRREVRLAGSGGQGLVLAGIILAEAAGLYDRLYVVQAQVYGPESRGGSSFSDVIIGHEEIDYPRATKPDSLLAMGQEAYDRFHHLLKRQGVLVYDEDLVKVQPYANQEALVVGLPLSRVAREEFGKPLAATVIGLVAITVITQVVSFNSLTKAVEKRAPKGTKEMNLAAVRRGHELVSSLLKDHDFSNLQQTAYPVF